MEITDHQFSIALTITFVPYIAAELPVSLLLKNIGAHIIIPLLVTLWGVVTTCQGFIKNYRGLLAARFLIGAIEGGLYPALVLYVSNSYRRKEIQTRIALFSATAPLSGAISGLLAYYLMQLDGVCKIPGWGWIFIIEGAFTAFCGLFGFLIYPRSLATCRFLTPDQRRIMTARLEQDQVLAAENIKEKFSWYQVFRALQSPHVLIVCAALFMVGSNLYGLAYFEPSIVKTFGYSPRMAQLVSVPPFALGFVAMLSTSYISDRYQARGPTAITMACVAIVGYSMFLTSHSNAVRYISLFLSTAGIYSVSPTLYTWIANNSAPHYRQATAIALGPMAGNSGGILSTWLFPRSDGPNYPTAAAVNLSFSVGIAVLSSLNYLWLRHCNRKKALRRVAPQLTPQDDHTFDDEKLKQREWLRLGDEHVDFVYAC